MPARILPSFALLTVCGVLFLAVFDVECVWIALRTALVSPRLVLAPKPPYPPSPVIQAITWDFESLGRHACGSDLWPITWAADDHLYTAWGDGGGFGGTDRDARVSLGVARIEGPPEHFVGYNVFGGKDAATPATFAGKSNGILSIDGILYMGVVEQDRWLRWKLGRSTDGGKSWTFNAREGWDFAEPDGAFSDVTFLTFGKDYQGARDGYVYAYSQDDRATDPYGATPTTLSLFRVPTSQIMDRGAYEYFAGLDGSGTPRWTGELSRRRPVFTNPAGVGWGARVAHHPGLGRYLLTAWHDEAGGWGLFDASEPWGPWTTVAYYETWLDATFKFGFTFPQKWMSADGQSLWLVFSGIGLYDTFTVIKATLTVVPS
jgi:hypothetical protein